MANPAVTLHGILSEWKNPDDKQIYVHREMTADYAAKLQLHRHAMRLISEIEQTLDGLTRDGRNVDPYVRCLDRWTKWVLAYPHDWQAAPNVNYGSLNDLDALDLLAGLGGWLDDISPVMSNADREQTTEALDAIAKELAEDLSLPRELRRHLHMLLEQSRQCVDEYELFGDFALRAAVDRLVVAVGRATHESNEPSRWTRIWEGFFMPTAVGLSIQAATVMPQAIEALAAAKSATGG